ncbi:hypothetical protein BN1222_03574 [Klebsiella quasipneumoniae]|uniref:hypothetical protein n=1 Tax=Klebsiella quasipneumoniae TaxID=1463165 RepID=UPI0005E9C9AA|nr:hypothetical protein [Klebsiella quasipneumoniae]CEL82312.1 hypothetical protein BN1222_03574 [Klebsiella quasipneumoniae]
MNKEKYNNTKDYPFLAFCNELSQCCSKLNALDVQIYSVMLDDAGFYEFNFGHYTPAHEDIALDCGVSRSSVIRCINNKLIPLGLVSVSDSKNGSSSTYRVHDYRTVPGLLDKPSVSERKAQRRKEALEAREAYRKSIASDTGKPVTIEQPPEAPQKPVSVPDEPTYQEQETTPQETAQELTEGEAISLLTEAANRCGYDWNVEGLLELCQSQGIEAAEQAMIQRMELAAAQDAEEQHRPKWS